MAQLHYFDLNHYLTIDNQFEALIYIHYYLKSERS